MVWDNLFYIYIIFYSLSLGADLINKLLDNFEDSLPRKRIYCKAAKNIKKFRFTKEDLENLLKSHSLQEIANKHEKLFGVKITKQTVASWRNKWGLISNKYLG